jgi:hypothetical protein
MMDRGTRLFGGVRIDTTDWPLIVMEMPEAALPDSAVVDALGYLELLLEQTPRGAKFFQVTDLSKMRHVAPPSQRKYAAEWSARTDPMAAGRRIGGAIVAPSAMLRGMLTAVFWLARLSTPTTVVSTLTEGFLHGIRALEDEAPPLPEHLVQLRARLTGTT